MNVILFLIVTKYSNVIFNIVYVKSTHLDMTVGTTYTFVPEASLGSGAFINNNTRRRQCLLVTDGRVERDSVIHLKES